MCGICLSINDERFINIIIIINIVFVELELYVSVCLSIYKAGMLCIFNFQFEQKLPKNVYRILENVLASPTSKNTFFPCTWLVLFKIQNIKNHHSVIWRFMRNRIFHVTFYTTLIYLRFTMQFLHFLESVNSLSCHRSIVIVCSILDSTIVSK